MVPGKRASAVRGLAKGWRVGTEEGRAARRGPSASSLCLPRLPRQCSALRCAPPAPGTGQAGRGGAARRGARGDKAVARLRAPDRQPGCLAPAGGRHQVDGPGRAPEGQGLAKGGKSPSSPGSPRSLARSLGLGSGEQARRLVPPRGGGPVIWGRSPGRSVRRALRLRGPGPVLPGPGRSSGCRQDQVPRPRPAEVCGLPRALC